MTRRLEKSEQEEAYTLAKMRSQADSKSCHLQVLAVVALVIALSSVLPGCGSSEAEDSAESTASTDQPSAATQTSEGGGVTVAVTWQGPSAGPVFDVAMDTHSVDLDGYDLRQLAVLRNDQGQEVRPNGWDAPAGITARGPSAFLRKPLMTAKLWVRIRTRSNS